jgi:lysophospholipase L1-like esterase
MKTKVSLLLILGLFGVAEHGRAQETADKPTIFVVGDSTARNNGTGRNGQPMVGWGTPLAEYFDSAKVAVANVAHAGQSSRTYYNNTNDWSSVLPRIKAGDFVLLVFGINDGGPPRIVRDRGSIPGLGDETADLKRPDGSVETAHTYGWYMSTMADAARDKSAHVYLLTVTTRNIWTNPKAKFRDATPIDSLPADYDPKQDKIERGTANGQYTEWTEELGKQLHLPVFDLTDFCADKYEAMGREAVNKLYSDHNHTYLAGAEIVAAAIVSGLKAFQDSPFIPLLSEKGGALATADAKFVSDNAPLQPIQISDVSRNTQMGSPPAPDGAPGNGRYFPPVPANSALPTLWLIGDSTVRNGTLGDGSNMNQWGWGAPLVAYFDLEKINVVNRAFGGTSSHSFYDGFFWQNLRPQLKKGDFVIMQFGANDNGSASGKGIGEETQDVVRAGKTNTVHTFGWYLQQFVNETRTQGATPIICSLTPRKNWTDDGHFRRDNTTHAAWAAEIAMTNNVPFVDLYELIARKYESLGTNVMDKLYVPSPREKLHTGWDGAVINSECVISGLNGLEENPLAPFESARGRLVAPVVINPPAPAVDGGK